MKTTLSIICITAASLLASQGALAVSVTKSPVYGKISPPYRIGDMRNVEGEEMVRVTKITALDNNGQQVELFSDKAGAILPRASLDKVATLINPVRVDKKGDYTDINITLADESFSIKNNLVHRETLTPGLGGTELKMKGAVRIGRYEVTPQDLRF